MILSLRQNSFSNLGRVGNRKKRNRAIALSLMLTPMVDMFSLLVIFLLQVFSTSPDMLAMTQGISLPVAASGHEVLDAPILSINQSEVFLDHKKVGELDLLLQSPEPLLKRVEGLRKQWLKAHPTETFRGEIHLQADRSISSEKVSRLMSYLSSQHFGSIMLSVISGRGAVG